MSSREPVSVTSRLLAYLKCLIINNFKYSLMMLCYSGRHCCKVSDLAACGQVLSIHTASSVPMFSTTGLILKRHDVKLHSHFHWHWLLFVLMCHEAGQSAFLHTNFYLSTNLDLYLATFLDTNSLYVLMCRKTVNQSINSKKQAF